MGYEITTKENPMNTVTIVGSMPKPITLTDEQVQVLYDLHHNILRREEINRDEVLDVLSLVACPWENEAMIALREEAEKEEAAIAEHYIGLGDDPAMWETE